MLMYHVVFALCTLSVGSAIPAFCDGDPYERNDREKAGGYKGALTFSTSSDNDGKYPHGTRVTLSCPSGMVVEGPKESECNSGQWEPKLGYCSSESFCLFGEEQKAWGYTGMIAPLEEIGSNKLQKATWAYFKCRNDSLHTFTCYRGQWKPAVKDSNRCGCAEINGEGASFTYTSPPNELGRYDPGTSATISCSGNMKPYGALNSTCTKNQWEPSPATCHTPCGGDPYKENSQEQSSGHATLRFTNDPYDDGTYSHNTRVTLVCTSGPVVKGSEESVCSNGHWKPKLGRCPNLCSVEALNTEKGFYVKHLVPLEGTTWQKHLGKADTRCYFQGSEKVKSLWLTCRDGEWDPPVSCPDVTIDHWSKSL